MGTWFIEVTDDDGEPAIINFAAISAARALPSGQRSLITLTSGKDLAVRESVGEVKARMQSAARLAAGK